MKYSSSDITSLIINAQDDADTVLLPNACQGQLIELDDGLKIRCFSILTRQPHAVPPDSWSMITTPNDMSAVVDVDVSVAHDKIMIDHVTRGIIGDSAIQVQLDEAGNIRALRLLPSATGNAQAYWEAQAQKRLET